MMIEDGALEVEMDSVVLSDVLTSVQFVETADGRRLAVMDADDWAELIEWLEDVEDRQIVPVALDCLRAGPEASGVLPLESVLDEL